MESQNALHKLAGQTQDKISFKKACTLLGVTKDTLQSLIDNNTIKAEIVDGEVVISKLVLLQYKETLKYQTPKSTERVWELKGDFATTGLKKMAKRTFQELASNIEELIVNSYDADAIKVELILDLDKNSLTLMDDGAGMDEKTLASYVVYGDSVKNSQYKSPKFGRAPIGEYGMGGKLAITNIGSKCTIITRKEGTEHTLSMDKAHLDNAKYLSDVKRPVTSKSCDKKLHGTNIIIEGLFYKDIDVDRLVERFSTKMPKSQNFQIMFHMVKGGKTIELEIKEPVFPFIEQFSFKERLPLIGEVALEVFYTKEPIPATKQGIWTKVNGRIVNEKQEWFGLLNLTSGQRYRWRLYGFGEANGLKDFINFSKNDFVDGPEYKAYYNFVHDSLAKVQKSLLQKDEVVKKEKEIHTVKTVEHQVNEVVKHLAYYEIPGEYDTVKVIAKVRSSNMNNAPAHALPDLIHYDGTGTKSQKRGIDKAPRRPRTLAEVERQTPAVFQYHIRTVDLSQTGDLMYFEKKDNRVEINEQHPLYVRAVKDGNLEQFVRDLVFGTIANDYTEGDRTIYDRIYNELVKVYLDNASLLKEMEG
jgi:hypothetical protein